jgi:hypothetical protein
LYGLQALGKRLSTLTADAHNARQLNRLITAEQQLQGEEGEAAYVKVREATCETTYETYSRLESTLAQRQVEHGVLQRWH